MQGRICNNGIVLCGMVYLERMSSRTCKPPAGKKTITEVKVHWISFMAPSVPKNP